MTELQRLRDRVEQLESVLGADEELTAKLMAAFNLTERDHAVMLGMLYQREVVTRDGLYTVLYGGDAEHEWPNDKIMDQRLHKLRAALKAHSIEVETVRAVGWRISRTAKELIKRVISEPTAEEVLKRYRCAFGLQSKQAQILALMMERPAVTASGMRDIVASFDALRWQVKEVRKALLQEGITVSGGYGRWSLTDLAKSAVREKLLTTPHNISSRRQAFLEGR